MEGIVHLSNAPSLVRTIAGWHQSTWGHLTGRSVEERTREFDPHLDSRRIPLTLVAFLEGGPVGSVSLLIADMDTHPDLSPWLGSLFVLPERRRRGIGARLCRRAMAEAGRLGVETLHLFTEDRAAFYEGMGWEELSREHYRGAPVTLMRLSLRAGGEAGRIS